MAQVFKKAGLTTPHLDAYVTRREETFQKIMKEFGVGRDALKLTILGGPSLRELPQPQRPGYHPHHRTVPSGGEELCLCPIEAPRVRTSMRVNGSAKEEEVEKAPVPFRHFDLLGMLNRGSQNNGGEDGVHPEVPRGGLRSVRRSPSGQRSPGFRGVLKVCRGKDWFQDAVRIQVWVSSRASHSSKSPASALLTPSRPVAAVSAPTSARKPPAPFSSPQPSPL